MLVISNAWGPTSSTSNEETYFRPVLRQLIPVGYVSPVVGTSDMDHREESEDLSWEQAEEILEALKPFVQAKLAELESRQIEIYERISQCVALRQADRWPPAFRSTR